MSEVYTCPECGSIEVTTEHHQMFMVNSGEHYCHNMKTHDSDSPAKCLTCTWEGSYSDLIIEVEKHTPAPWQVSHDSPFKVCDADGENRGCSPIATTHGTKKEKIANARLIAAAPELLDALKFLYGQVMQAKQGFGMYDNSPSMDNAVHMSEVAIGKAISTIK